MAILQLTRYSSITNKTRVFRYITSLSFPVVDVILLLMEEDVGSLGLSTSADASKDGPGTTLDEEKLGNSSSNGTAMPNEKNASDSEDDNTPTPLSMDTGVKVTNTTLQNGTNDGKSLKKIGDRGQDERENSPPNASEPTAALSGSGSETDLEDNMEDVDEDEDFDDEQPGTWDQKLRQRNRNLDVKLPDTVTRLRTAEGSDVYLVGTAHFSLESQEDVAKTIRATQPDVVVVELCRGRANILQLDEETILEEAKNLNFNKIHLTIKQNGLVQGLMYLFLLNMSAHLTKQLGMAPGGEFRRAFAEAMKVRGCVVRLGDRPIQITLQRALAELSLWQKLCLAWCMLTSKDPISKEEVEKCKQRDLLEEMLNEMTGKFPALSRVFVKERDIYLAHSLHLASTCIPCIHTKAGCLPAVVVGVVGIGHVSGIVEHWEKTTAEDIPPLLIIPETSLSTKVFKWTMKASMMSGVVYCCYKVLARPAVMNIASKVTRTLWK